jgi:uncharacterized surface protein with fasciclin (FAS1) repeats
MKEQFTIYDIANKEDKFSTFTRVINAVGLADALKSGGPYTLFAPTNEAFSKLPEHRLDELLKPENKERLTNVMKYHLVSGKLVTDDVKDITSAKTLQGQELKIKATAPGNIQVNNAKVITPSLTATNGIILPVDSVLMPQATATAS